MYCTSLGVLFGVKWYADELWQLIKGRGGIEVNLRHNLIEVIPKEKKAIFENLDKPGTTKTINVCCNTQYANGFTVSSSGRL